jgi:hypothetical protein
MPSARVIHADEVAELSALARRLASRLEAVGGDDYPYRLARAHALSLCDALDELWELQSESRPSAHVSV